HISRISHKRRINPTQCLSQAERLPLTGKRSARHVLYKPVDEEEWPLGVARHQRVGGKIVEGVAQVLSFGARNRNIDEGFWDFFGCEPGEPPKEPPAVIGQLPDRRLPSNGDGARIARDRWIKPRQNIVALRSPLFQILRKSQPALGDED